MMHMLRRACLLVSRKWIHSVAAQDTSQKLYRARLNTLIFAADRLLLTPRADTLEVYLMRRFSDDAFYNTYRAVAFMRLVRFCLERHLFDVALTLHDRMLKEGFLAVHALSLRMSALKIAQQAPPSREILSTLKTIFQNEAYDIPAFMDLVHYLSHDKHASGALVDDLARAFVAIRQVSLSEYPEIVGELASINMRANRLDAAQKWLQVFEDTCGAQDILPDVTPYSIIISTLNDLDPTNADAIQDVLVRMKSAGVSPDVNVFNTLIRVNFVQRQHQEAFALYHLLMDKRSNDLMPNDVTYKTLFRATLLLNNARRRHRRPESAVPPRRLFREMLTCYLERTNGRLSEPSTVVSVSAFHLALRTFMACEDYAAAFILIHALPAFGFQPNLQTYLIVVVNLLHRMKREANLTRSKDAYRLVDFLTHLRPNEDPDLDILVDRICNDLPSSIGTDTISHLLALGEDTSTDGDLIHSFRFPSKANRHARIPTVAMLTGAKTTTRQHTFYSPAPLARIVYKALLGELFPKAVRIGADWDWKGTVGSILEQTRQQMVPEGVKEATKEAEKRWAESQKGLPFKAARMKRRRRNARCGREITFDFES